MNYLAQVTPLCRRVMVPHSRATVNNLCIPKLDSQVYISSPSSPTSSSSASISGYVAPEDKGMLGELGSGAMNMVKTLQSSFFVIVIVIVRAGNSARRKAHPDTSSSPPSTLVCGALVLQENSGQPVAFIECLGGCICVILHCCPLFNQTMN